MFLNRRNLSGNLSHADCRLISKSLLSARLIGSAVPVNHFARSAFVITSTLSLHRFNLFTSPSQPFTLFAALPEGFFFFHSTHDRSPFTERAQNENETPTEKHEAHAMFSLERLKHEWEWKCIFVYFRSEAYWNQHRHSITLLWDVDAFCFGNNIQRASVGVFPCT